MGHTARGIRMRVFFKVYLLHFSTDPFHTRQGCYQATFCRACIQNFDLGPTSDFINFCKYGPHGKRNSHGGGFSKYISSYIFLQIPSILGQNVYQVTLSRACIQYFDLGLSSGVMDL